MTNNKQVHSFMREVLSNNATDLSVYANDKFCNDLRLVATDHILFLLFKINTIQLMAEQNSREFHLPYVINTPHPESGVSLLEYCVVAGLGDIAVRLAFCGALSLNITNLRCKFSRCNSNENHPEIMLEIRDTLRKLGHISRENQLNVANMRDDPGYLQQLQTFCGEHKSPVFLFGLGLTCSILSPLIHGAGSILLLSVGIPSMLSSIGAYQNSRGGKDNRGYLETQHRVDHEAKEIKYLLEMAREIKRTEQAIAVARDTQPARGVIDFRHAGEPQFVESAELILFNAINARNDVDVTNVKLKRKINIET